MRSSPLRALCRLAVLALALVPAGLAGQELKDPSPPAAAPALAARATGGPDAFGYTFADGSEPACATGGFIDIGSTGSFAVDGDDTASAPVTLGAAFDLYGASITRLVMGSNGFLTTDLGDAGPDLSNDCPIPATPSTPPGTAGRRLYPLHDDLDLQPGIGRGLYQFFASCPRPGDRCAAAEPCSVFQWDRVAHYPGGGGAPTWDLEVVLYHTTNDLVFLYGAGNPERGSGSTTGLQSDPTSGPGFTGLQVACNGAGSIPDQATLCIFHPNPVPGVCQEADLDLTQTAEPEWVSPGDTVVFTLTVENLGPGEATNVVVTDALPAEIAWVSDDCGAGPPGGGAPAGTLLWSVGNLADRASAVCRVTVRVEPDASGTIVNTATARGDGVDPVAGNNSGSGTFGVQQGVLGIPTLDGVGLAIMTGLLMAVGLALRRRAA